MCDNCFENLRSPRVRRLLARGRTRSILPGPTPTAAGLERHARKYGPAMVTETAAEYGLSVAIERPVGKARARRPSLKERVAVLVAAGHGPDVVAEMENLSPARARRLVEEVS